MTAFLQRTAAYVPVTLDNLVSLPVPTMKFTGKTIIVTGSNTGIGLEAARYFVRLDAAKVILAVCFSRHPLFPHFVSSQQSR